MTTNRTARNFVIALETSGSAGGVAIGRGGACLEDRSFPTLRNHAAELLPTVSTLCADHGARPQDLAAVFVSIGPGSFTGLRVAVTVARTLALENDLQIVAVPTMAVVAQNALLADPCPQRVVPMIDAMRKRVFASAFELREGRYVAVDEPAEVDPVQRIQSEPADAAILGGGAARYADSFADALGERALRRLSTDLDAPRARVVLDLGFELLGRGVVTPARDLVPLYIRPPEAEEKWAARNR